MFTDPFFTSMGLISAILTIFGIIAAILWALLPFAVFGIKKRLDKIIEEMEKLNSKVAKIEKEFAQKKYEKDSTTLVQDDSKYMPKNSE